MRQIVIDNNPNFHKAWPSVARAANGNLVVTYKESDGHLNLEFSNLVVRVSSDQGLTWSDRIVLAEVKDPVHDGLLQDAGRITALQDGSLLIAVSKNSSRRQLTPGQPYLLRYVEGARTLLFRSVDYGLTWQCEEAPLGIPMISTVRQLRSGTLLIGATRFSYERNPWHNQQIQDVYRSTDNGRSWQGPIVVCDHPDYQPSEGDFVELDDGTLVCYIRDEDFRADLPVRMTGLKCLSYDDGLTWEGPFSSGRWLYNGRMSAGRLPSGEIMVTTRLGMGKLRPYFGTFHDEPRRKPELVGYWHGEYPLLHAYIESQADARLPTPPSQTYADPLPPGARWFVIDNDLSPHPDFGYSGWVSLPSGEVYVVDFITDDAPPGRPQIRGYLLSPEDWQHPQRGATFDFAAEPYRHGTLAGQADWVHHAGPSEATVLVDESDDGQAVLGRPAPEQAQAALVSNGWIAPSLDLSRLQAETVRRDIGPFNLFDEHLTIAIEHRGQAQFCAFQVLDDCQAVIVEVQAALDQPSLRAYRDAERRYFDSGLAVGQAWWRTRIELRAGYLSLATGAAGTDVASAPWCELAIPELQVVASVALRIGGQGRLALRKIIVNPHRVR
jgi:sialidase-1